jgi:hypothetical protein
MASFFSEAPPDNNGDGNSPRVIAVYLRITHPIITDDWQVTEPNSSMLKKFKKWENMGYDGIIFTSDEGEVEYIVFHPDQIRPITK